MQPICCAPASVAREYFFCTAGRGMERFVSEEVTRKASATEVEVMPGKVFFSAESDLCKLKKLKSAERLFLLLIKGPSLSLPKNKGKAISALRKYLIEEDPQMWVDKLDLWNKLQEPLNRQTNQCQNKAHKRKLERETTLYESKSKQDQTAHDSNYQSNDQKSNIVMNQPVIHIEDKNYANDEKNTNKRDSNLETLPITFRVSCRCTGANGRIFTAQEVGKVIGLCLMKHFGWKSDLRMPLLEVFVHLNDNYTVVGLPIMRHPLASREYIQRTGLRSTTAWAMTSLAEVSPGFIVLDPMCGVGTILLEAAQEWPGVHFLGIDVNDSQLKSAVHNTKTAALTHSIEFLKGSILGLPIRSEYVDVLISDIPFGKKFTASKCIKQLLPDILREMERVVRVQGVIVLLLSQSLHHHLKANFRFKAVEDRHIAMAKGDSHPEKKNECTTNKESMESKINSFESLIHVESHAVSLGVTEAVIFKCRKT
ncbi:THUMP domain-containing protein 2 [Bombina bombina]|uniref:THUMP domain-containing protein 2 n=1 Tax=Bombina bombina TaxID=8345 RepID=UPI00235AE716|nr:THUMP domain-containing protein 2 [Bombina bombina]